MTDQRRLLPSPDAPLAVARVLAPRWLCTLTGLPTRRYWRGDWLDWTGTHWTRVDPDAVRAELYMLTEHAYYIRVSVAGVVSEPDWNPSRSKIADLIDALASVLLLPEEVTPPVWIGGSAEGLSFVPCRNGLLDIGSRILYQHSPAYFNLMSIPLDWNPSAPEPVRWLRFLKELWDDDWESILALQQWFGYILSGRTDLQKILFIYGKPRSGKGTIARILAALIGEVNRAAPTLQSLGGQFGLANLIDKPLAVIGDVRLRNVDTHIIVERLLSISGEDALEVDRKYKSSWVGQLPTRIMFISNDPVGFSDASGAVITRLIGLRLDHSFLGHEDPNLERELRAELAGILAWALDGLTLLNLRGSFIEPASSAEILTEMMESASPVKTFFDDRCEIDPPSSVRAKDLYLAWRAWCFDGGRVPGTIQTFARQLHAATDVRVTRPRTNNPDRARYYEGIRLRSSNTHASRVMMTHNDVINGDDDE